jgi:hypothetical protein
MAIPLRAARSIATAICGLLGEMIVGPFNIMQLHRIDQTKWHLSAKTISPTPIDSDALDADELRPPRKRQANHYKLIRPGLTPDEIDRPIE